jgi:hypothetical protein
LGLVNVNPNTIDLDGLVGGGGGLGGNGGLGRGLGGSCPPNATSATQLSNIERFIKKLPTNAKDNVILKTLPNNGVAAQAASPGRVPGSSAVYEKQINAAGETTQYTKTTYDPQGNIVHVKDKINGDVFP